MASSSSSNITQQLPSSYGASKTSEFLKEEIR